MRVPTEFGNCPIKFPGGTYRAFCQHVVDGDTFDVLVDLGFNQYAYVTVRLHGVDCPEIFHPADEAERARGVEAQALTRSCIEGKPVRIVSYKDAVTFGRYVADVSYLGEDGAWRDLAAELTAAGLVKGPKRP